MDRSAPLSERSEPNRPTALAASTAHALRCRLLVRRDCNYSHDEGRGIQPGPAPNAAGEAADQASLNKKYLTSAARIRAVAVPLLVCLMSQCYRAAKVPRSNDSCDEGATDGRTHSWEGEHSIAFAGGISPIRRSLGRTCCAPALCVQLPDTPSLLLPGSKRRRPQRNNNAGDRHDWSAGIASNRDRTAPIRRAFRRGRQRECSSCAMHELRLGWDAGGR